MLHKRQQLLQYHSKKKGRDTQLVGSHCDFLVKEMFPTLELSSTLRTIHLTIHCNNNQDIITIHRQKIKLLQTINQKLTELGYNKKIQSIRVKLSTIVGRYDDE